MTWSLSSWENNARSAVCVIKLGGSLLGRKGLSIALGDWLEAQSPAHYVWIAGGGPLADAVRNWDSVHGLGQEFCHQRCLELMSTTAELARYIVADATGRNDVPLLCEREVLQRRLDTASAPSHQVFDIGRALRDRASDWAPSPELPHHWDVTSDSLAALVARELQADELVLLKSCLIPDPPTVGRAVECGVVDAFFPHLVPQRARVRFVQLSDKRGLPER